MKKFIEISGRFFFSALYGCLISVLIAFALMDGVRRYNLNDNPTLFKIMLNAIWITPIVWGILGMFRYEATLDAGKNIIDKNLP